MVEWSKKFQSSYKCQNTELPQVGEWQQLQQLQLQLQLQTAASFLKVDSTVQKISKVQQRQAEQRGT